MKDVTKNEPHLSLPVRVECSIVFSAQGKEFFVMAGEGHGQVGSTWIQIKVQWLDLTPTFKELCSADVPKSGGSGS